MWRNPDLNRCRAALNSFLLIEPFWIALLAIPISLPGTVLSIELHGISLALLFLFWPIRWVANLPRQLLHRPWRIKLWLLPPSSPLTISVLALTLLVPLGVGQSTDAFMGQAHAGYLLLGIAIWVASINWAPVQNRPEAMLWLIVVLGGVLVALAVPFTAWKSDLRLFRSPALYDLLRQFQIDIGETIHANVLAGSLAVILPMIVALIISPADTATSAKWPRIRSSSARVLLSLIAVCMLLVILITQSRGAYLATGVVLPMMLIFRWPRTAYLWSALVVLFLVFSSQLGTGWIAEQLSNDASLGGWQGRLNIWAQSLRALQDFPFTGIGFGSFSESVPLFYLLQVDIDAFPHAHNLYIQVALDLGIPGLVLYLSVILGALTMAIHLHRTSRSHRIAAGPLTCAEEQRTLAGVVASGAIGAIVAQLLHGLWDSVTWDVAFAFVPWLVLAVIALAYNACTKSSGVWSLSTRSIGSGDDHHKVSDAIPR